MSRAAAPSSTAAVPSSARALTVGAAAVRVKGRLRANRYLLARRLTQLLVLALFVVGPWYGWWIVKGNLSSSLTLGTIPLSDPFVLAQTLAAGHLPQLAAVVGAALVIGFYALAGGRAFCSWVCPVNAVTDGAGWLRRRLRITSGRAPARSSRYWLLAAVLLMCALTGAAVWETVNPVSMTQRAIIFGGTFALLAPAAVIAFDLLVAPRGWCGHLCPHGAAYGLIGRASLTRVSARASSRCNDCGDCYAVCPEPQVIPIALKGKDGAGPVIRDAACTNCGRCIDVCSTGVFRFTHRWDSRRE